MSETTNKINIANLLRYAPQDLILYSNVIYKNVYFSGIYNSLEGEIIAVYDDDNIPYKFTKEGYFLDQGDVVRLGISTDSVDWRYYQSVCFKQSVSDGYVIVNNNILSESYMINHTNNTLLDKTGFYTPLHKICDTKYRYATPEETYDFFININPILILNKIDPKFKEGDYIANKNALISDQVFFINKVDLEKQAYIVSNTKSLTEEHTIYFIVQEYYKTIEVDDPVINPSDDTQIEISRETVEIPKSEFRPGEIVLCRNVAKSDLNSDDKDTPDVLTDYNTKWTLCVFSHIEINPSNQLTYYVASGRVWDMCIPYNKANMELIGTNGSDSEVKPNMTDTDD